MCRIAGALSLALVLGALSACQPSFEVYDLRCEGLAEPLSIDSGNPHFSWKIRSDAPMEQAAYEIVVEPGLWRSGKVESPEQVMVPYGGAPLPARQKAVWKVRVWRTDGKKSAWSSPQRFGTSPGKMNGEFIGAVPGEGRSPLLRKRFKLPRKGDGLLYVTSLGYHEVYVNGKKIGDAVLSPAVSQLDKRSLIVTYDVSRFLKAGENEILIAAGSGWYKPTTFGAAYDGPLVKAELTVGGETVLVTDSSWEGAWSGRRDLGRWTPHEFGGEYIDAGATPVWSPVDVVSVPGLKESPQMCEPVKVLDTLYPVDVHFLEDGRCLVDYGRVVNAMMDVTLPPMPEGSVVEAFFTDYRHPDGTFENDTRGRDVYVSSGAQEGDRFVNRFNHHLMRYMVLSGLKEAPEADKLKALQIGDSVPWSGTFESSDPDLNAIYSLVENSLRNLTFGGYQVDCASIERLGYGGDGNASAQTFMDMADASPLYLNWLQAWADAQRPDGGLPHTAPNPYSAGGGPYWCSFPVQAAWRVYRSYGDPRAIERFYPVMKKWLEYVDAYSAEGLLGKWPNLDYRGWYLGDWAAPEGVDVDDPRSVALISNCTICQVYLELEDIARFLGLDSEAASYRLRYDKLRSRIHEKFYHDGIYASGSQIDMVFPLLTGVVPEELKATVTENLKRRTADVYGGHLATGLVGVPVITEWAVKEGETEWLHSLLKKRDYPGYLWMARNGATGTWEEWDGGRSHLHNCYNGIGSWFFEALGGIRALEPGYRSVSIAPQLPDGVEWVRVTKPTPYGDIKVFARDGEVDVEVPVGVKVK